MLLRGDAWMAAGGALAVAAAPVTIVGGVEAGLVLLSLGVGLALVGSARMLRGLRDRVAGVGATTRHTRRAVQAKRKDTDLARRLDRLVRQVDDLDARRRADSHRFRTSLDTLPSDLLRLQRYADLLAPTSTRLPGLGHWAVTPGTLVTLLDEVYARPADVTVLECGSGASTLYIALALAERGLGGQVIALESDPAFAEETRAQLRRHGADRCATVIDAPLVEQEIGGEQRLWYDLAALPEPAGIDLLFVDGPIGGTSPLARYPALPVLGARLNPAALVVLDDTDRADEKEILRRWTDATAGHPSLVVERHNVRTTFLRLVDTD